MRSLLLCSSIALPLSACLRATESACQDSGGGVNVTIRGEDLGQYNNRAVHARLLEVERDGWVVESGQAEVRDGAFKIVWECGAEAETSYLVHVYIDVDGNLDCSESEPAWRMSVSPSVTDVEFVLPRDGSVDDSLCDSF